MTTHQNQDDESQWADDSTVTEILGYLNFSNGSADAAFRKNINAVYASAGSNSPWDRIRNLLLAHLSNVSTSSPAFENSEQAKAAIEIVFDRLWPAYRKFHSDLLFHLSDQELQQPFFLTRLFEVVLAEGPPWTETERIIESALDRLNHFVGFRPVAVLENGQKMQAYEHERYCPIPLYLRDSGVAVGRYQELVEQTLEFLRRTDRSLLSASHFDIDRMDEFCLDVRAHDHNHPVNKRTNYMFGEWDPHLIDTKGYYRRFVVRAIILDAMLNWMDEHSNEPAEELLHDAAAVLCGTILMASSISGAGPETHSSDVTLTSLLPAVARQRDYFYDELMKSVSGQRAKRLEKAAATVQQPFGHVRQYLNLHLAQYGSQQVQHRHLAKLYSKMGFADESREQAAIIPALSTRMECEIQCRITDCHHLLEAGKLDQVEQLFVEIEEYLNRGIGSGAFVDPWNILGFHGQFPLFSSREDSIPDQRIEMLLEIMDSIFDVYSRALAEAAALGQDQHAKAFSTRFRRLAEYWDRFAIGVIEDLPDVPGVESWESAVHVSQALAEWRAAGESAGDISFWRGHVESFQSPKAYARVVSALLEKQDYVAAMGLMMQWLSQGEDVGLESGPHSFHPLLLTWMNLVTSQDAWPEAESTRWKTICRMFDYLEANAGSFWLVPSIGDSFGADEFYDEDSIEELIDSFADEDEDDEEEDEDALFEAAYDGIVYRDSASDGNPGEMLEGGFAPSNTEFDMISRHLEPRLRFLITLAQLWQIAAAYFIRNQGSEASPGQPVNEPIDSSVLREWFNRTRAMQSDLSQLLLSIWEFEIPEPLGDHDSNVEYDLQLQTRFFLMHSIIATHINCRIAERVLAGCLSENDTNELLSAEERQVVDVYRAILRRNLDEVRNKLPGLLKRFSRKPLLYVPLESSGHPFQILTARTLQTDMRFLLSQLPQLGMLNETWHVLRTAYRMEHHSRPEGVVVTEFDRVFRTALRSTLEFVVQSANEWESEQPIDDELVDVVGEIVDHYLGQWMKHSRSMRLSTVEGLDDEEIWQDVQLFIQQYGSDLFHAKMLTLGNVRAILHDGIDSFINYLDENEDPLHPNPLLRDLENGDADPLKVIRLLELIYGSVVDKFDRFLEYNTTTTQSDYGEMFFCFLDFLRAEAKYERDAWNFAPIGLAHEVLARSGRRKATSIWETVFENKSSTAAEAHLQQLWKLQDRYGVRLPFIADRLNERFVKPLAVHRMLAMVPQAMREAKTDQDLNSAFLALRSEVDSYLKGTAGSAIEVPAWLEELEKEVDKHELTNVEIAPPSELSIKAPPVPISLAEIRRQLRVWNQPLGDEKRRKP